MENDLSPTSEYLMYPGHAILRNTEEISRVIVISCAIRGACCSFYGLSLCLKTQQEAISQKEIVFQSLRKAGILLISGAREGI